MDLSSMLNNDNGAPEKKPSHTSAVPIHTDRARAPQASPPPLAPNGAYPGVENGFVRPDQPPPLHAASTTPRASLHHSRSAGLTPLHTPSHTPASSQYPFPSQQQQQQQPLQSPASAHPGQSQYRSHDSWPGATTPGARPSSHGYAFAHSPHGSHSLGQQHASQHGSGHHGTSSLSPTPSSHHSQTSHSMRHSPLATMGHPPQQSHHQQHASMQHYHHSQPSTPLGPPPHLPQRHSNQHLDMNNAYHNRTPSAASNGYPVASPAQHHPGINNLVDSPGMYNHHSPDRRRTSEYHSSASRERSVSVSPKTMVPPRPPALGSRQSSQQEPYSARNSVQPSTNVASVPDTRGHVHSHSQMNAPPQQAHSAIEVAQSRSQASAQLSGAPNTAASLSHPDIKTPPQHQPTKMEMSRLLAPTEHAQPQIQPGLQNGVSYHPPSLPTNNSQQSHALSKASPPVATPVIAPSSPIKTEPNVKAEPSPMPTTYHNSARASEMQQPAAVGPNEHTPSKVSLKRQAESEPSIEPPLKRERRRKYTERPVWAHLSRHNPRSREPGAVPNGSTQQPMAPSSSRPHATPTQQMNGQASALSQNGNVSDKPWQQQPPLDNELIQARRLLGKWEKSLSWNSAMPPLTKAVTDWLFVNLTKNADVGHDSRHGTIEIEAKIGTLVDVETGQRCNLPVANPCVIQTSFNRRYQFESRMNQEEHKNMNAFLNEAIAVTRAQKGRVPMEYEHIYETDSFRQLSENGLRALPDLPQTRNIGRDIRLRTSVNTKTGALTARIVKTKIADDLHIFGGPAYPYDIRISMNLEVNLLEHPDPESLIEQPTEDKPAQPDRQKDRVSYRHLGMFSVDLTRVDRKGMAPNYELELEVDARRVREQMDLAQKGEENALVDVVDGFVNNGLLLMKQRR